MKTKLLVPLSLIFTILCCCCSLSAQWTQIGQDINGEAAGDRFGTSVSLSNNESTIAIGASRNDDNGIDAGHVRIYDWNGNVWVQRGSDIDGEAANDRSGESLDLSSDGNTIVIGAFFNDGNGNNSGHVRVYDWSGTTWAQRGLDIDGEAANDYSGISTKISSDGNTVAIGAHGNAESGFYAGHVRIYDWSGTTWIQRGLDIDGEAADDVSGTSIKISSDGNTVIIGAPGNDGNGSDAGHVRIYDWNGNAWIQRGLDIDGEAANNAAGNAVSINNNGNTVAIGASQNDGNGSDAGHVRIYVWNGIAWTQQGQDIDGYAANDRFGSSVSISDNGNTVAIGAPFNTGIMGGYGRGHVRIYDWNGNVWIQRGSDIDGEAANDRFGESLDLSSDGNTIVIGAPGNNGIGHVRVYRSRRVYGIIYQDFNQNCIRDTNDIGVAENRNILINPGNIIAQTNLAGFWSLDSLPVGNYTITVDTSGNWQPTCPTTQSFTVVHPDSVTIAPSFGFISTTPCPTPDISIQAPFLRPGFSNQKVHVQACNQAIGTALLGSVYVVVELDSLLTVQSSSMPHTSLGNNQYQIYVGDLYPNQCADFYFDCTVSLNAVLGQSLCMQADLYPVDSCSLDTIPNPFPTGSVSPCTLPWDKSSLQVEGSCVNDSVRFVIYNTGDLGGGDMDCYAPVRLYIDGQYILLDSIQLVGGDSMVFMFAGDGRTWHLEADQHPLHPGNSHPNANVELCGNADNWTPNLVNILPHDDANPVRDVFCGIVTGSYDPNDKRGFPLGITNNHNIDQNQELDYTIRFQNTGTDTAFTVVIRDTLPMELDIFSVRSGASSHNYEFRMYGPRVLEWTFPYIYLVDSTTNEPESHGFVSFKVRQNKDLPIGTIIENNAGIYFDFNAPIITNRTLHTIGLPQDLTWDGQQTINSAICAPYTFNGITYNQAGTYFNTVQNGALDSLYTLNLSEVNTTVIQTGINLTANATGATYQWIDCQTNQAIIGETAANYTASANGNYAVQITKDGCVDTSACYSITVVGVEDIENAVWQLYPNPTKGNFSIALDQVYADIQVRILDVQGRIVATREYTGQQYLELALEQTAGLYFIQVYTNEKEAVFKLLKK